MSSLEESAEARANAPYRLRGKTPRERRIAAQIQVKLAHQRGKEPEQWVLDVAEGRLPA